MFQALPAILLMFCWCLLTSSGSLPVRINQERKIIKALGGRGIFFCFWLGVRDDEAGAGVGRRGSIAEAGIV